MTGDGKAIKITLGINEECVDSRSLRRHKRKALVKKKKKEEELRGRGNGTLLERKEKE